MALIVEDGTLVAGANSYISLADAETYMENHIDSNWTSASTDEKTAALFEAGMYLNSLSWKGQKVDRDQSMELPRVNLYDCDGYLYDYTQIPQNAIDAQVEASRSHLAGYSLLPTTKPDDRIKRKKIDVLEKEFFGSASSGQTTFSTVDGLLKCFVNSSLNGVITRS